MYNAKLGLRAVTNVILVSSGKGGVGKSTVAANLAAALHVSGAQVGILDADVYGPSQALMFGVQNNQTPLIAADFKSFAPYETTHGLKFMSIATRITPEQSLNWKGAMVTQVLHQLIFQTEWGALDYLIVDMPPGTGDVQIYIADKIKWATAVVVTTPQDVSVIDCVRGCDLLVKNQISILGIVENMSYYVCACCNTTAHIFPGQGGQKVADQYQVPLLAQIPLVTHMAQNADTGTPSVLVDATSPVSAAYIQLAKQIKEITDASKSNGETDPR